MGKSLTMTPADVLAYQSELVRTGQYLPLGRANKISIGPSAGYVPPPDDPYIRKFGRLIEFRDRFLPIALSVDRSMILVPGVVTNGDGKVGLPDVPDPDWVAAPYTPEELAGEERRDPVSGNLYRVPIVRSPEKTQPRMIPQRLEDRTNEMLEGTNFLVFSPVINIAFQPELQNRTVGTAWIVTCVVNPADGTHTAFLVDRRTGEAHFFGGLYDISGPLGE